MADELDMLATGAATDAEQASRQAGQVSATSPFQRTMAHAAASAAQSLAYIASMVAEKRAEDHRTRHLCNTCVYGEMCEGCGRER